MSKIDDNLNEIHREEKISSYTKIINKSMDCRLTVLSNTDTISYLYPPTFVHPMRQECCNANSKLHRPSIIRA